MDFLERYFLIARNIAESHLAGVYKNLNKIEKCISLLCDFDSKELYKSEIIAILLSHFVSSDVAIAYSGLMSKEEWVKLCNIAAQKNYLPGFECYDTAKNMLNYFYTTTYYLEQYKYKDLVKINAGDIAIDCGGCLGDTAIWMLRNNAEIVYSFEIDKLNVEYMKKNAKKFAYQNRLYVEEYAVSDNNGNYFYLPNQKNAGSGRIYKNFIDGSYEVKSIKLDDFCFNNKIKPNFIKMDIEGAERLALIGAKGILRKYKPNLAICIYHSWEDRFEIPILINNIVPEYKMYLKKSHPFDETVLFCTTAE